MKLRLIKNSTNDYTIERKDGWLSSWEPVYGASKGPFNLNTTERPVISSADGGWFYKDKQFALESMEKYMKEFKIQELENSDDDFKTIVMDSKDWA